MLECADNAHGLKAHIISVRRGGEGVEVSHLESKAKKKEALLTQTVTSFSSSSSSSSLPPVQDGGCTCPGDVAKAIGAGADFVMLGGMLAGHDESGGEVIERAGKKRKLFYGMSSATAMKKHKGGVAEYRCASKKGDGGGGTGVPDHVAELLSGPLHDVQ